MIKSNILNDIFTSFTLTLAFNALRDFAFDGSSTGTLSVTFPGGINFFPPNEGRGTPPKSTPAPSKNQPTQAN